MERSILYNMIQKETIQAWREEIKKKEDIEKNEGVTEFEEKLKKILSEEQKELLKHYRIALSNNYDYLYYNVLVKLFRFTLQAGMEIQKANDKEYWE